MKTDALDYGKINGELLTTFAVKAWDLHEALRVIKDRIRLLSAKQKGLEKGETHWPLESKRDVGDIIASLVELRKDMTNLSAEALKVIANINEAAK